MRTIPLFILAFAFLLQNCGRSCSIKDPFYNQEIGNYKCKSKCKTDAQIQSTYLCVRCISQYKDTVQTCDYTLSDSLWNFYASNPNAGSCAKLAATIDCEK